MNRKGSSRGGQGKAQPAYRNSPAPTMSWRGTIERLAWGGLGLATAEDGRLILLRAPLALFPGEVVEAQLRWKPRHAEGTVTRWVKRDPRRAATPCPVAEACGGCDLWEAGAAEGELKRQMAADLLGRQLPEQPFTFHAAPPEARRHRIQLHWDGRALGYHRRGSHALVPVTACPAAADPLSKALPRLIEALEARIIPGRPQRWELVTGTPAGEVRAVDEQGRAWLLEPDGWHKDAGPVVHRLGGLVLKQDAGAFFQVAPDWAFEAFRTVLEGWDLRGGTLYDLYGGVGFFSAMLGTRFRHRVLVEGYAPAVARAVENLAALGLSADTHAEDVGTWVPEGLGEAGDLILLDPPRAGLDEALATRPHTAKADRMVLIGCDGAPFCRDVQRLAPTWKVKDLHVLDLFPRTVHAEFIALLEKA